MSNSETGAPDVKPKEQDKGEGSSSVPHTKVEGQPQVQTGPLASQAKSETKSANPSGEKPVGASEKRPTEPGKEGEEKATKPTPPGENPGSPAGASKTPGVEPLSIKEVKHQPVSPEPKPQPATPEPKPQPATPEPKPQLVSPESKLQPARPDPKPQPATPEPKPQPASPEIKLPPAAPELKPQPAAPALKSQPVTPESKSQSATPEHKPQAVKPEIKREPAKPEIKPQPVQPEVKPQLAKPEVKPQPAKPEVKPQEAIPEVKPHPAKPESKPVPPPSVKEGRRESSPRGQKRHSLTNERDTVEVRPIKVDSVESEDSHPGVKPETEKAGPKRQFKRGRRAAPTSRLELTRPTMSDPEAAAAAAGKPAETPATPTSTSNADDTRRRSSVRKPLGDVVYNDDGYFDEELEESGEPSQAVEALLRILKAAADLLKRLLLFVLSTLGGALPLMLQVAVFSSAIYLLAEYAVSPADPRHVGDFPSRIRYVIRGQAWPLLPCVLSYVVSRWKPTDVHRRFAEESFRQLTMMTPTLIVRSTHASVEEFHWIWVFAVVTAIYSWSYWLALSYGRPWMRRALSYPPLVVTLGLMICSFSIIAIQDLGFNAPSAVVHRNDNDDTPGYWKYATMCHMIERAFCSIDGELPRIQY